MDDDIRDRFRGVRRRVEPTPNAHRRPPQPTPRPAPAAPRPMSKSDWPSLISRPAPRPESKPAPPRPAAPPPKPPKKAKKKRKNKGRRGLKRTLLALLILLLLAGIGAGGYLAYNKFIKKAPVAQNQTQPTPQTPVEPKPTGTIRFIAVGTSLAFESINNAAKKPDSTYDYLPMMAGFKPFFEKSDVRLCSQATPGGGDNNGLAISGYPTFNAPVEWSSGFASLGCNVINLASDHINDKQQPAIDATLSTWDKQANILAVAGANRSAEEKAKIRYFTAKGVKFAFLAYTTSSANKELAPHGVNMYSDDLANQEVAEARKNAQLVIVSMNWGAENSGDINADQDKIAQNLASQNVDVIIGGGPRVLQPAKVLNGKDGHQTLVWFSLGNFLNSELPVENLIGGMAVMDFDVATGQITDPKLLPVYMHYEWTPQQKAAGTVNARHDFKLMPLDVAGDALAKSLNNTTVEAQTTRVTSIITKFLAVKVIKSTEF